MERKIEGEENWRERKENSFPLQCLVYQEGKKYLIRQLPFYSFILLLKFKNVDNMVILY